MSVRNAGIALIILGVVFFLALYSGWGSKKLAVEVAKIEQKTIQQRLDEDGLVKSDTEVLVRPQIGGRVAKVLVINGESVRRGQLLAVIENEEGEAAARQAAAQVEVSRSSVAEAEANVQALIGKSAADQRAARASVSGARANLDRVLEGARKEEIQRAQAIFRQAQAKFEDQKQDFARRENLFREGALAKRELEASQAAFRQAEAAKDEAKAGLQLLERGSRRQDQISAASDWQRSLAQVEVATAENQQVEVAQQQVHSSRMRLTAAQAEFERAVALARKGEIRAGQAGILQWESVQVGDSVTLSTVVARIVEPKQVFVELLIDQNDIPKVHKGQEVVVTCDAFASVEFSGKVIGVDPMALLKRELRNSPTQDEDRVFRTRVRIMGDRPEKLRPGMTVFAEIPVGQPRAVTAIVRQSLVQQDGRWSAFRIRNGTVERVEVKLGQSDGQYAEILSGLSVDEQVVLNPDPTKLSDGLRVVIKAN